MNIKKRYKIFPSVMNTVRFKLVNLVVSIIIPFLIIAIVILFFFHSRLNNNVEILIETETTNIIKRYNLLKKGLSPMVRLLVNTPEIIKGADIGKINLIIQTLKVFKNETKIPFVSIHDKDGFSLGKGHKPDQRFKNDITQYYVKYGLKTKKHIPLIMYKISGIPGIFSQSPVLNKNSKITGIATTGYLLDKSFSVQLKTSKNAEIFFILGKKYIGGSLKIKSEDLQIIRYENKIDKSIQIKIKGNVYKAKYVKINQNFEGKELAILIAVDISRKLFSIRLTIFFVLLLLSISLGLSLFISYKIARRITSPVYDLVKTSKLIGQGNYNVRADIKSNDEFEILGNSFNLMIEKIQENINELDRKVELNSRELKKAYDTIKMDLSIAKRIQTNFLKFDKSHFQSIEFEIYFQPLMEIGGDIYNVFNLSKDYYRIFLANAGGHGIKASLLTMIIKSEYEKIKSFEIPPDVIMKMLNSVILNEYSTLKEYFSCMIMDIDIKNSVAMYSSAGHPSQFIVKNHEIDILNFANVNIGTDINADFKLKEVEINKGTKFILFTFGIYEKYFNNDANRLDEKELAQIIESNSNLPVKNMTDKIINNINDIYGKNRYDDITLICLEILN